jgi:hypothetical protein
MALAALRPSSTRALCFLPPERKRTLRLGLENTDVSLEKASGFWAGRRTHIDPFSVGWYAEGMRLKIWIMGASLFVGGLLGCGDSQSTDSCADGDCVCEDQNSCVLDCEDVVPCAPSCLNFVDSCIATCTDDCNFDCRGGDRVDGVCRGTCGVNCDAHCSAVGNCIVNAGADSSYLCLNAVNCAATLEDGGDARCVTVSGTCTIKCKGTCDVRCTDVGACNVDCEGQERTLCASGFYVCGKDCPAPTM